MASLKKRRDANTDGDFYVDNTCIDCGTCRWVAPYSFEAHSGKSRVHQQPETEHHYHRARMALLACPVAAIGSQQKHDFTEAQAAFPEVIDANVYHCGYHSEKSYGATSYLIVRSQGNVLIDSPRFTQPLVKRIEELGGVQMMFLTHADDVADHEKFYKHFACERILHQADISTSTRNVEIQPHSLEPAALDSELLMIPVPGHTRGSMCLLYKNQLFIHRRPPGMECGKTAPHCIPRLLLVQLARAD